MIAKYDPLKNGVIGVLPGGLQLTLAGFADLVGLATDEQFHAADAFGQRMRLMDPWEEGWVVQQYVRREQHSRPGVSAKELCREYARARSNSTSEEQAYERYMVRNFFPDGERFEQTLGWLHHRVAWGAGLDIHHARVWLEKAERHAWSPSRLRAELRAEVGKAVEEDSAEGQNNLIEAYEEYRRFDQMCASRLGELRTIEDNEARRILDCMACAIEFIDALRARVATPTGSTGPSPSSPRR